TRTSTLSLHDALPIYGGRCREHAERAAATVRRKALAVRRIDALRGRRLPDHAGARAERVAAVATALAGQQVGAVEVELVVAAARSEEHTSELQSRENL